MTTQPVVLITDDEPDTVYLTVAYAAACIEAPRTRLYKWLRNGHLRTRTRNGQLLVAYTDVIRREHTTRRRREIWQAANPRREIE